MAQAAIDQFLGELDKALKAMPYGVAKPRVKGPQKYPFLYILQFPDMVTPYIALQPMPDESSDLIVISSSFSIDDWTNNQISIRRENAGSFMTVENGFNVNKIDLKAFVEDLLKRLEAAREASSLEKESDQGFQ